MGTLTVFWCGLLWDLRAAALLWFNSRIVSRPTRWLSQSLLTALLVAMWVLVTRSARSPESLATVAGSCQVRCSWFLNFNTVMRDISRWRMHYAPWLQHFQTPSFRSQ